MRADGLYGAFVVHPPTPSPDYDDDALLLVGDWYHDPAAKVQQSYDTWKHWGMEPSPDSLLVNGRGLFNCSRLSHTSHANCSAVPGPAVHPRSPRSRLRIVNVG